MGKESGIYKPSAHEMTELSCKFGKQDTVMSHGVYDVTWLRHVVHRGVL